MDPIYLVHCRRHPGQYEYYKDYDDLEASCFLCSYMYAFQWIVIFEIYVDIKSIILQIHFRQDHHLCENEACIAKKFVVFTNESELKVTSLSA